MKFREPKKRIQAVDIRFDREKGEWQRIVGDRIVPVGTAMREG
jgi:hypothetical protein